MLLSRLLILSILLTPPQFVDVQLEKCKEQVGKYKDRDIYIYNNVCYIKNYDIYINIDSFMSAAVRVL